MGTATPSAVRSWQTSPRRAQRLVEILDLLGERGLMSVDCLCRELRVSSATLRRDMTHLEEQGLISRTHGGARPATGPELPVRLRDTKRPRAKHAIGVTAAALLPSNRPLAVAIGGGSTAAEVARELGTRRRLTIVTNALTTAAAVAARPNLQVIMTGGVIRANSFELVGSLAESAFNGISVHVAILGADGVSVAHGVTTHDPTEARTNHAMVSHAHRLMVVADGSKIGRATVAKVADASAIDILVTDASADPRELAGLKELGVRVRLARVPR
ncbi:DeoR family transcriptional regulator [Kribbella sp. VKM Ac-2569]|uniref:DeoR/GlpR family DNA-binding transcription regulator n=1 Tax=Kribbella sp. VKM Ac-2569 TaxID=2512220 RepID=UPI00102B7080|nr:DeoR/GlpR family DNA-binding transcription regulator [Kribbella sp. VKM Ac-2569]RZT27563.1 DeoR family transcriptional regulator [Kribbella sp. VKM Ac-2569]